MNRRTASSSGDVAAIDVGGTTTKAALVAADGSSSGVLRRPTPSPGPDLAARVLDVIGDLVGKLRAEAPEPARAVGVVVPGLVDDQRGVAIRSANLQWRDVPLRELVAARTGLLTVVAHDVRAGALAEARLGAARGASSAVFVPIGTGIAAGLVLAGEIYSADGLAGEIGHVATGGGQQCVCGATGCLEAVASAAAIVRRYRDRTGRDVQGAGDVARLAEHGDPDATLVWSDAMDALATAVAWLAAVVAPEIVVIGGGLAESGDAVLEPLRRRTEARLTYQRRPRIVRAALGDRAGCLGAGLLGHCALAAQ